jgi:hypothetical protein
MARIDRGVLSLPQSLKDPRGWIKGGRWMLKSWNKAGLKKI